MRPTKGINSTLTSTILELSSGASCACLAHAVYCISARLSPIHVIEGGVILSTSSHSVDAILFSVGKTSPAPALNPKL